MTITDLLVEVHDTHHPIASSLYYHQQKQEARQHTLHFIGERVPKYLDYFERVLRTNTKGKGKPHMIGRTLSYIDLSAFQVIAGLRYAFPRTLQHIGARLPGLGSLARTCHPLIQTCQRIKFRERIPFNEYGIFRHYPEL